MLRIVRRHFFRSRRSNFSSQYTRLKVISGKNIQVPSERIPAGIYVSINVDSERRWITATKVLSSEESVVWGSTVTLSCAPPALSIEIRASYEVDRMLGSGELIGKLQMSWDELLGHGDEPFDLAFPPVRHVRPSLTLKATVVHTCNDQAGPLPYSLIDCEIGRETDAGHARFAEYMTSWMLSRWYLNNAVQHFQFVLNQCPVDHPNHAAALTNLAVARLEGYIRSDLQDIDTTTSLLRKALALRLEGHPDHTSSLYNLVTALIWRYSKESTAVYIHESAQLCCKLLPLCPEGTFLRSIGVDSTLGYVISSLPIDGSDEGIHLHRNILELCPLGQQHRPKVLNKLGWALFIRFTQCGNIDDIDESIHLHHEAASLCPEGHPDRGNYLNNLASSLSARFHHQGKPNDLDEAISLYEEALQFVGYKFCDFSLDNLGSSLIARFNKCGNIDDITRTISLYREALTLRPPRHPHRDTTLSNLALALKTRYDKLDVSEDLNEAIDLYRKSLRLRRLDHPECHRTLFGLSWVLCSPFTHTRENQDVEEAIQLCQESLALLPSLHPDRCFSYAWLQNFRLASKHSTQGFPQRIIQAYNWTVAVEQHGHGSALEAYSAFFELLDAHLATRSSATSRREAAAAFHYARTLPVDAASCAIRHSNIRRAVELVEQGRGQQWSLASRLKTPVEVLESATSELAHKYLELSKLVSNVAQSSATITERAAADQAATEYRRLTRQWEAMVAEIRSHRAFSRFLLPPLYEDLQAAACQGPVIILIASEYSCSAIIVPMSGELHHDRFARAIRNASKMEPKEPRNDLIVLLRTVWNEIMLPIVNVLQQGLQLKSHSRIWLCPTAAFTSIPLHAAHPFKTNADRSKEPCLEDLYICSYTPTLSALVRSRQMVKKRVTSSFATIGQGQPSAGRGKTLLAVDSELELVQKLIPETASRTTISGDAATRADPDQPYNSHFVMKDEHLTLLDIMERDVPYAEFAFLSACHTAVGDEKTPDEVIHLAAGLQFAGFKSVIGTLWEVNDAVAKHVVEAFYKYMFDPKYRGVMNCARAAWALNCATHAVKTTVPLEQRMVFIHIGV
ncbi:TPR-like protein [Suillus decipiens]|nr:TPR-like protein [Suillus decipiens]